MIELYKKNRVIFLSITIILFISASVIYYYSSKKSDLENCADEHTKDYIKTLENLASSNKKHSDLYSDASFFKNELKKPLKEKIKHNRYISVINQCENWKNKSPESFKLQYGN